MIAASRFDDDRVTMTATHNFPAAQTAGRPVRRAVARIGCLLLLAATCMPALAQYQQPSSMSGDSADAPATMSRRVVQDSMSLSDRALLLATDLNRLLAPPDSRGSRASGDGEIKGVLQRALALLGTPYRWGGTSPDSGFDCSGLVGYVFRNALGIELPRVSREMAKSGQLIADRSALAAGDLVFFGKHGEVDHVGIYVGDGRFVHAPRTGRDVTVSSLETGYWSEKFLSARRVHGS